MVSLATTRYTRVPWRRWVYLLIPFILALIFFSTVHTVLSGPLTPPNTPIITEPAMAGQIANPADVHMETAPFSDPDPGDTHFCSDWQIIISATLELVWEAACVTGLERVHAHLGDGAFMGSYAGRTELEYQTEYLLRVRHQDQLGEWSLLAQRDFQTGPPTQIFPLELDDVVAAPAPQWLDGTGTPLILPAGAPPPFLRLESAVSDLILQYEGVDGTSNAVTNPGPLAAHVDARIHINAGNSGTNLILPESDLSFTDDEGVNHTIYLPSISLTPTQSLYFWISANGSTYVGTAAQTQPDFSQLARGAPVPWAVLQPGYKIEVVATGFQLPVSIAFVPEGLYPGDPGDPYYYVTELYGKIKVVTRDGNVYDYATDLLNFNPTGAFPGSGEQGVTGIAIDPATGDVYANMLYSSVPYSDTAPHYPKVMRFQSLDGGLSASTQITILNMIGESQGQSHQISNLTIGPDNKLYVHMGDGFDATTALNLDSFRGKILRLNLDGTAPPDNPFYTGGGGSRDYIYAYGFRNPFGGAWRDADGELYEVENGPSTDRFARVISATSYGWAGSNANMLINAIYNWNPSRAPVDIAFIQNGTFNGSGFPAEKQDHAFVTESGPTWASGPQTRGKRVVEFVVAPDGTLVSGPTTLVEYNGSGKASAAGMAAGPDGLYFTDLYKDLDYTSPIDPGANILRIRFVGVANFDAAPRVGLAPLTVNFTNTSTVSNPTAWLWDFGDGSTSTVQNPTHTYTATGTYTVSLRVTGDNGLSIETKQGFIIVGDLGNGIGLLGQYYEFTGPTPPANPFQTFVLERVDSTVDFNWGTGSPDPSIGINLFSVDWVGQIAPLYSENYTLFTYADDGIRLWVDNQLVVDDWSDHAARERSGNITLTAGRRYDIRVEFYENGGDAVSRISWQSPSQPKEVIPQASLYPPTDLSLVKTASSNPIGIGSLLTYTFDIANNGPYFATGISVTDVLPPGLTFVSGTGCSQAGGVVTCTTADLNNGSSATVQLVVHVPFTATGSLINTAVADNTLFDHIPSNNTDTVTVTIDTTEPPHIYVASTLLNCSGRSPCTDDIQEAIREVANNGRITILDSYTIDTNLTTDNGGSNTLTIDGPGTLVWDGSAGGALFTLGTGDVSFADVSFAAIAPGTVVALASTGNLTMRSTAVLGFDTAVSITGSGTALVTGNTFDSSTVIFAQTNGTLTAYANNSLNYTTALSASGGTRSLTHNWWGTYTDPAPAGLDAASWDARLGAPVASWADGSGATALGNALLSGGTGTAVIVNHGRLNYPFGNGITGSADDMCSDYYDFFTVNGGGSWTVELPVDDNPACNTNTRDARRIFWITDITECSPANNPDCWDLITTGVSINGQNLVVPGLSVLDLGGTPFVAGSASGHSPTAIQLQHFNIQLNQTAWLPGWLLSSMTTITFILLLWRRRKQTM